MQPKPNRIDPLREPAILGIDNVPLEVVIAQAGSRILAVSIDQILLILLQLCSIVLVALGISRLGLSSQWVMVILVLVFFSLQWGYFAIQEILMDGRTLGKSALGLRVVSRQGGKASVAALVVRNLIRSLDMLFGMPLMLIDPKARRLGDLVAGTLVVHERVEEESEIQVHRLPTGWGGRHAAVIEGFLARVEVLEPERAEKIADRLLGEIARLQPEFLAEAGPVADPVVTLRRILSPSSL